MGKNRTSTSPRKMPVQARSRATFDALIQAATYILTEVGWEGLTTNAIAERAGVNIGSLYQYFPNKEAVITELQRRHAEVIHEQLNQALARLPQQPSLRTAVTQIIEMVIQEHRIAPAVHKAITEELPRTARCLQLDNADLRKQFLTELKPYMKNVPDPDLAIYMMGIAVHAIIHHTAAERPALLARPDMITELVTLFENYLCRPTAVDDEGSSVNCPTLNQATSGGSSA
jgi:AcrR family transcriptional regulator